ncbi:MAG: hypothetical protein AAGI52_17445 [Bacteroidota bacterium]
MSRIVLFSAIVWVSALSAEARERPAALAGADLLRAQPSQTDTLRYQVRAGHTLIVALPTDVEGREVDYRLLEAPALSWLVDRSFMWRTTPGERGTLPILVERSEQGGSPDTLVLLVEIIE